MASGTPCRRLAVPFAFLFASGCGGAPQIETASQPVAISSHLFDAETAIADQWTHVPFKGKTDYRLAIRDGRIAIRAVGQRSASGLIRHVAVDLKTCPILEWSWSVATLQDDADIRVKDHEDVAASLFLIFGDPGLLLATTPVPTIRYVWTNGRTPVGAVVDNLYFPGIVRSIVLQNGLDTSETWITERRNIVADYRRAFGSEPKEDVQAIALFTDNDQTGQPVEAYYAWGRSVCAR